MGTWNAYGNEDWPADYLIDAHGNVRYATIGEGDYGKTETAIRALLAESGAQVGGKSHPTDVVVPSEEATPETYLGTNRAQGWINGPTSGTHDYGPPPTGELALNDFAYSGTWKIAGQPAEAVSRSRHRPGVRGQARLPRAELSRRTSAAGAGAARRPPDLRRGVPAQTCTTASSRCAASACTRSSRCRATNNIASRCASPRRHRLRVHVRVASLRQLRKHVRQTEADEGRRKDILRAARSVRRSNALRRRDRAATPCKSRCLKAASVFFAGGARSTPSEVSDVHRRAPRALRGRADLSDLGRVGVRLLPQRASRPALGEALSCTSGYSA